MQGRKKQTKRMPGPPPGRRYMDKETRTHHVAATIMELNGQVHPNKEICPSHCRKPLRNHTTQIYVYVYI